MGSEQGRESQLICPECGGSPMFDTPDGNTYIMAAFKWGDGPQQPYSLSIYLPDEGMFRYLKPHEVEELSDRGWIPEWVEEKLGTMPNV